MLIWLSNGCSRQFATFRWSSEATSLPLGFVERNDQPETTILRVCIAPLNFLFLPLADEILSVANRFALTTFKG